MAKNRWIFAFDLDGTVTRKELLPLFASAAADAARPASGSGRSYAGASSLVTEIHKLTCLTLSGEIPFEESFRRRFALLKETPLEVLRQVSQTVPLDGHIQRFISDFQERCVVITGNLDAWITPLVGRLGCRFYCSSSRKNQDELELFHVLSKDMAVQELKKNRPDVKVLAVGESVSDVGMFKEADFAVSYSGVHTPVAELAPFCGYSAADGRELCSLLRKFTEF